jgi:hypothetical protein
LHHRPSRGCARTSHSRPSTPSRSPPPTSCVHTGHSDRTYPEPYTTQSQSAQRPNGQLQLTSLSTRQPHRGGGT